MSMPVDIIIAAVEPLTKTIGWHGFAYGLLGLKTIRKMMNTAANMARGETFDPREVPDYERSE